MIRPETDTIMSLDEKKQDFIEFVMNITNEKFLDYIRTYSILADSVWNPTKSADANSNSDTDFR